MLSLLQEFEEEEEILRDGNDREVAVVYDRRKEKERLITEMSRVSLPFYAKYVLHMLVVQHHKEWSELIVKTLLKADEPKIKRQTMCLLAPRDHGKSAWFSYALPLWLAHVIFPGEYGAMVGEGDISWTHLRHLKEGTPNQDLLGIIHTPELLHLKSDDSKKTWTKDRIQLANGSEIFAKGAKSALRGQHTKWMIIDDLLAQECLFSPTERKRALENFKGQLLPAVNGPVFVVGTPMHTGDLYGYCKHTSGFIYEEFPALQTDEEGVEFSLWPSRFSVEQLHYIRDEEVGPLTFTREYLCKAISSLSTLFPEELFAPPTIDESAHMDPSRSWIERNCEATYISADIGISANIKADYTVFYVVGISSRGIRRILLIERARGLGFRGIIKQFIKLGVKYRVDAGIIESNQAQAFVVDEAIIDSPFPIERHQTGSEKHMADRGIPMIRLLLENGKFRFPFGDPESKRMSELLISELQSFTVDDGRVVSTSKNDDIVMAMWFSELLLQKFNFGGAFFDDEEDSAEAGDDDYWLGDEQEDDDEAVKGDPEVSSAFGRSGRQPGFGTPAADDFLMGVGTRPTGFFPGDDGSDGPLH